LKEVLESPAGLGYGVVKDPLRLDIEDGFPSFFYRNDTPSMEDIIARSQEANELTMPEDIIAIVGAIPSGIISYMTVHCDLFPSSIRTVTYILAIAIGNTIAIHFEALRLLAKSRKI
jgi:hypothetical protein